MHPLTGDREQVLQLMKDTYQRLGQEPAKVKGAGVRSAGLKKKAAAATERDEVVDALKRGYNNEQQKKAAKAAGLSALSNERAVDGWYAPRDRNVAVFQSVMEEYLDEVVGKEEATSKKSARGLSATKGKRAKATMDVFYGGKGGGPGKKSSKAKAAGIFDQYSNLDPRWVEVVYEKAKILLKGKRPFITHKSVTDFRFDIKEESTIAVVGDWGGGNVAAQLVAKEIAKIKPDHIIHLGDVYYAGTPKEIQDRFLKYWPTPSAGGYSFALNSNHEMYSGGYGYFDLILKQFKQPASYFSLANKNWRFIGLDTGYIDHDLNKEQVDWLTAQFKGNNQKTILLSHHQLFSAYEKTDASNLQSRVQPLLDAKQIYGWIWGHEHLCVVYKPHMGINAVCLGNGCFPYNPPKNKPQVPVAWINDRDQTGDKEYRGIHTFALITVKPDSVDIQYIDQDGVVGYKATWK